MSLKFKPIFQITKIKHQDRNIELKFKSTNRSLEFDDFDKIWLNSTYVLLFSQIYEEKSKTHLQKF